MRYVVRPSKVALVGFSQGAALSMVLALTSLHDLGGVASLSGWIPHLSRPVSLFDPRTTGISANLLAGDVSF